MKFKIFFLPALISAACLSLIPGCTHDNGDDANPVNPQIEASRYPLDVATIIVNKCATAGCHNTQSKEACSGLDLTTWDKMFEGNHSGAVTIAYRADASPLFTFCNLYPALGDTSQNPKMPVSGTPLTQAEVQTLQNWINSGAKDKNGIEKFPQTAGRRKFYVSNQGCDNVSVFDAQTKLVMRLVDVGNNAGLIESPHMIKVSPDGNYWYGVFTGGNVVQKFSTLNDMLVGSLQVGSPNGYWSAIVISQDGSTGFVSDWASDGRIAIIDLNNMTLLSMYGGGNLLSQPHGLALYEPTNTLYVTGQIGNFIYKVDVTNLTNPSVDLPLSLEPGVGVNPAPSLNPHEISIAPGDTMYFVTCELSNEVRAYRISDDALLQVFPGFNNCKEMSYSITHHQMYVSCLDDYLSFPGYDGSVGVIDYSTLTFVKRIYTGNQPHGLAVDDQADKVYVANINGTGPAPHHKSLCGGRNGYVTIIDMQSLETVPSYKHEVSVFPYSVTLRN